MDSTLAAPRDENAIAKQRWESFKLGGPGSRPASLSGHPAGHSHKRSHSRNASISSTLAPLSMTNTLPQPTKPQPDLSTAGPGAKRNSHHRRRSSVSTRHESAEIMGLSLPDLPQSNSEDNFNLGEKDSIRRRALWALEGKTDHSYTKVEIPELSTPQLEKKLFDFTSKSAFPAPTGNMNKRDSFKMLSISSSAKDHLHTLVEEEEEEEETLISSISAPALSATKTPTRPKVPQLRPLSLTPDSLISHGLPTPSRTPSPNTGLKSLTLSSSPSDDEELSSKPGNLRSFTFPPAKSRRRPSNGSQHDSSSSEDAKPARRSSISYRTTSGLPTPEATPPAWDRRFSFGSISDEEQAPVNRPLSVSEQHFLVKSHNALLARITDLERVLSTRPLSHPRTRPLSLASDSSSATNQAEPNDEMLQLISDLKSERDELKRDVDGWRRRVTDTEGKMNMLAQRVEAERREAWIARSRVGLLEVEKSTLQKAYDTKQQDFLSVQGQCHERDDRCRSLERQLNSERIRADEAEAQVARLNLALASEKQRTALLEKELEAANLLATPTPQSIESQIASVMARKKGLGFQSMDSGSSGTIVDGDISEGPRVRQSIKLGSVQEEEDIYEEDDGLAGYEDEQSDDEYLDECDDDDEFDEGPYYAPVHAPLSQVSHGRKGSLTTWTFPKSVAGVRQQEEVDRFFGCLEEAEQSPPLTGSLSPYENAKSLFAMGFNVPSEYTFDAEPESPTFVVPGYGTVLHSVTEEDEDEEESHSVEDDSWTSASGIMITFTPPESETAIVLPLSPIVDQVAPSMSTSGQSSDEPIVPFSYTPPTEAINIETPPAVRAPSPVRSTSPSSIPRRTWSNSPSSPSSIPRKFTSTVSPKLGSCYIPPSNAPVTPPTKRGTTPSSIPIPNSPSSSKKTSSPSKIPTPPTFARQPPSKKTSAYADDTLTLSMNATNRCPTRAAPSESSSRLRSPSLASRLFSWSTTNDNRTYVSRERQLAKLQYFKPVDGVPCGCARCDGALVCL